MITSSAQIRQSFLDFFRSKGHTIVSSASLLPTSPNLLFTNAGMNAFVPYFLGERESAHKRIADTQKCIRAGGKHNDLDDVGFDTYHHTLFEMLGNWSIGDYFKKEAIAWAWELLTEVWKFPKERLYVTVYKPGEGDPATFDEEAWSLWETILTKAGLDPKVHIRTGGKKDNFWMMGETGPCGPCSEVHIDLTPKGDTRGELVNKDSPFCIEIWNLVFIQFNACEDGTFQPLAARHIDTGMGFERVAGILSTTKGFTDFSAAPSNYSSDLFTPIFARIAALSGQSYGGLVPGGRSHVSQEEMRDTIFRVLADHARALSCSIADGILPGNEGRNYVLRRILRRAVLYGRRIKLKTGFFSQLVEPVVDTLGGVFPELIQHRAMIEKVILSEEESFGRTLDRGLQMLDRLIEKGQTISGSDAFVLYDTYGFPLDLTQLIAGERGLLVDTAGFSEDMEKQRERARSTRKKTVITVQEGQREENRFRGYPAENLSGFATQITGWLRADSNLFLTLETTPFYAEMGGQPGDHGTLVAAGKRIEIADTIKGADGRILHKVKGDLQELDGIALTADSGSLSLAATAEVDRERRLSLERHHSATHLLHHALREVVGSHVHQAGSLVEPNRLRFDFSHFEAVPAEALHDIEQRVNRHILSNLPVHTYEVPFSEKPENCIAFFGDKYGDIVRVVDIGGFSVELCGGTHVRNTGEIGPFRITSESAIATGTRRIEAIVGESALSFFSNQETLIRACAERLSSSPGNLLLRLDQVLEQHQVLEKQLRSLQQQERSRQASSLSSQIKTADNGLQWLVVETTADDNNELRNLAVDLSRQHPETGLILLANTGGKAALVALLPASHQASGFQAGQLVRELAQLLNGKGGGKPDFAMGGAPDGARITEAVQHARRLVGI